MKKYINYLFIKNNFISYFLSTYILLTILNSPSEIKIISYLIIIIALIIFNGLKKPFIDGFYNYYPYLIFVLICSSSFIYSYDPSNHIDRSPRIENLLALFLFFVLIIDLKLNYKRIMDALINTTVFYLIISLTVHYFYYQSSLLSSYLLFYDINDVPLSGKNTLAIYLCFILPFAIHKLSNDFNIINFFVVTIIFLSIFYTFSRTGAILTLMLLFLFLLSFNKKYIFTTLLIITLIISTIIIFQINTEKYNTWKVDSNKQVLNDPNWRTDDINKSFSLNSARADYIFIAIEGFLEKPIFGHGLSNFKRNNSIYDENNNLVRHPIAHNDYAQIIYEMGVIGILSFLMLFIFNIYKILRNFNLNKNFSLILIFQIFILGVSLNTINLTDHILFWATLAITTFNIKKVNFENNSN